MPEAEKGAILNARILWTFSAAYRLLKRPEYLAIVRVPKNISLIFSMIESLGAFIGVLPTRGNRRYQKTDLRYRFCIYGLSEYYRATTDKEALEYAVCFLKVSKNIVLTVLKMAIVRHLLVSGEK